MKKILYFVFAAMAFAACSDDTPEINYNVEIVDFESAGLGEAGFVWGKEKATEQEEMGYDGKPILSNIFYGALYTEKLAQVYTYYSDYGHTVDAWNGFVISNHTDRETEGYTNDKSVYAQGGVSGSKQFAMGCYGAWTADGKGIPTIRFTSPVAVLSVAVANSTYAYLYFTKSVADPEKPDFRLVVTGYNGTEKTGEVSHLLVGGKTVKSGWEGFDLALLGTVTSLSFTVECKDEMAPFYFCLDDLIYEK